MRLGEVAKLILLSFDATLRSDLSVGMPIDLLCTSATHWMCDACGESTRMTTIIENFPTNGPKPSELRLPAWTSTKIDRQRSPSRPPQSCGRASGLRILSTGCDHRPEQGFRLRQASLSPSNPASAARRSWSLDRPLAALEDHLWVRKIAPIRARDLSGATR